LNVGENYFQGGNIKKLLIISLIGLAVSTTVMARADFKPSTKKCQGIDKKIDKVNSRLRNGYTVRKGERLKDQLRELKSNRFTCTTNGFSVD
jgi:hypothetical protein